MGRNENVLASSCDDRDCLRMSEAPYLSRKKIKSILWHRSIGKHNAGRAILLASKGHGNAQDRTGFCLTHQQSAYKMHRTKIKAANCRKRQEVERSYRARTSLSEKALSPSRIADSESGNHACNWRLPGARSGRDI